MEPTYGEYDMDSVEGIDTLRSRIADAETIEDWSFILSDYISWGNNKIANSVAIFNMNSATDCPNADKDRCQVPWSECYAHKAEKTYPQPLDYRRRQEYLWDCLDADTWAEAFLQIVERKRNPVTAVRFSEAGDFRHRGDIIKVDRIAKQLSAEGIDVYTYSASSHLDWSEAKHFTVNQSNNFADYGDRLFTAVEQGEELPEDMVWCPYDVSDGEKKCGDCQLCINSEGPDVAIELH